MTGILVDTSVWSLAFRKKARNASEEIITSYLTKIIRDFLWWSLAAYGRSF